MLYNIGNTNTMVIYFHSMVITAVILFYNGKLQGGEFYNSGPWDQYYKTFYGRNLQMGKKA